MYNYINLNLTYKQKFSVIKYNYKMNNIPVNKKNKGYGGLKEEQRRKNGGRGRRRRRRGEEKERRKEKGRRRKEERN